MPYPHSSREEQRSQDGTVSGWYSYSDHTGREIKVDYRASPDQGYHAYGPTIPQIQQQIPVPVQDTQEVQDARKRFFKAYNDQVKLIREAQVRAAEEAKKNAEEMQKVSEDAEVATPPTNKKMASPTDFKTLPGPIPFPDESGLNHGAEIEEDDEADNDAAVVIEKDDAGAGSVPEVQQNLEPPKKSEEGGAGPEASYKLSVVLGGDNQVAAPSSQHHENANGIPAPQATPIGPSYQISHMVGTGVPPAPQPQGLPLGYHHQGQGQIQQMQHMQSNGPGIKKLLINYKTTPIHFSHILQPTTTTSQWAGLVALQTT